MAFRLLWHDRRGSCAVQASTSSALEKKYAKNAKTCQVPKYTRYINIYKLEDAESV